MERGGRGAPRRGPPPGLAGPGLDLVLTAGKAGWQVEQWKSGVQETRLLPRAVQVREGVPGPGWWPQGWRGVDTHGQEALLKGWVWDGE